MQATIDFGIWFGSTNISELMRKAGLKTENG